MAIHGTPGVSSVGGRSAVGSGHGIEHLLILVNDLTVASRDFREKLGFVVSSGLKRPGGWENASAHLLDEYLELVAIYDRESESRLIAEMERFLTNGEGAAEIGVRVSSAADTLAFLRSKGLHAEGPIERRSPFTGPDGTAPVVYRNVQMETGSPALDDVLFFTEPDLAAFAEVRRVHPDSPGYPWTLPSHPNSAIGNMHPWLAVSDLRDA